MTQTPPRVFISYAHEPDAKGATGERLDVASWVLALAQRLRGDGVDAWIDRYEAFPPQGWRPWMTEQIEHADRVLLVCTEEYQRRFDGGAPGEVGRGVRWESQHITQQLYDHKFRNTRYVPVLPPGGDERFIPLPLKDYRKFHLDGEYEALYRLLTDQHDTPAPVLGQIRRLAPLAVPPLDPGPTAAGAAPIPSPADQPNSAASEQADAERMRTPLLRCLDEAYAYKEVHDALQRAAIELGMISLHRDEFPGGGTLKDFSRHALALRKILRNLVRIEASDRCEANLMHSVIGEYEGAIGTLDQAVQRGSKDELEQSIENFESLLAYYLPSVDGSINTLAKQPARESDAPRAAIEQLRPRFQELQRSAALHSQCQRIDNKLALIRKSGEREQLLEIGRQWRSLAASLEKALPDWTVPEAEQLRSGIASVSSALAVGNEEEVRVAFDDLCATFGLGFFEIDSNLKELCRDVKQAAEAVLRPRQGSS